MSKVESQKVAYQNNPFMVAIDGLGLFFKNAQSVAIAAVVLTVIAFILQLVQTFFDLMRQLSNPTTVEEDQLAQTEAFKGFVSTVSNIDAAGWVLIGAIVILFILGVIVINTIVKGVVDYTAAMLAKGRKVSLLDALRGVMKQFLPYLGLNIVVMVKIFLWSLLFIVPGIIMAIRYSLYGVAFFSGKKGINESISESLALTKNAWLTTFASMYLFNAITLGLIEVLLMPGTLAVLYRQYKATASKPDAHVLSWLTLILPIVLVVLFFLFVALMIILLAYSSTTYMQN